MKKTKNRTIRGTSRQIMFVAFATMLLALAAAQALAIIITPSLLPPALNITVYNPIVKAGEYAYATIIAKDKDGVDRIMIKTNFSGTVSTGTYSCLNQTTCLLPNLFFKNPTPAMINYPVWAFDAYGSVTKDYISINHVVCMVGDQERLYYKYRYCLANYSWSDWIQDYTPSNTTILVDGDAAYVIANMIPNATKIEYNISVYHPQFGQENFDVRAEATMNGTTRRVYFEYSSAADGVSASRMQQILNFSNAHEPYFYIINSTTRTQIENFVKNKMGK